MVGEKYWLVSWLRFALCLVILLQLVESCLRCWLSWLQFVNQFGELPDFLDWKVDAFLLDFSKNAAFYLECISNLALWAEKIKLCVNTIS